MAMNMESGNTDGDEVIIFDAERWYRSIRQKLDDTGVDPFKSHRDTKRLILDTVIALFDWSAQPRTVSVSNYGMTGIETNRVLIMLSMMSEEVRRVVRYLNPREYAFDDVRQELDSNIIYIKFKPIRRFYES